MKDKFYLTGLDWMIHAMCGASRRSSGMGIASQIVLELDGSLEEQQFKDTTQRFASAFPMLNGKVSRSWRLDPYWKNPPRSEPARLRVEVHHPAEEDVLHTLETCVNTPFRDACEYVVFHLIYPSDNRCLLAMTFDHRLLDARGAEQFMLLFCQYASGAVVLDELDCIPDMRRSGLISLWKKGLGGSGCIGRTVHKSVIGSNMVRLKEGNDFFGNRGGFLHVYLNAEDSQALKERACREAGYLMFMPYALAAACSAFGALASRRKKAGSFIVPCTTDLRDRDNSWKQMFFNYCSLFFFKVDSGIANDRIQLIKSLKEQFFRQTKEGFPQHLENFLSLMRYIPVRVFEWMNSKNNASFSFASVGESLLERQTLFNLKINNLYHFPLIPPHVGIGFFFTQFNGRINMGVSFREGMLSDEEKEIVRERLRNF